MTARFAFPTIPHLAPSQGTPDDTFMDLAESIAVLPRTTVVQPKRDGLNLGVRLCEGAIEVVLKNRPPNDHEWKALQRFRDEVAPRLALLDAKGEQGLQIFGELDVVAPDASSWVVFDAFNEREGRFLSHEKVASLALGLGLRAMSQLQEGPVRSLEDLDHLLEADPNLEGLILRCEGRGYVERFKYVRQGFRKSVWRLGES